MLSPAKQFVLQFVKFNYKQFSNYLRSKTISLAIDDSIKERVISSLEDHNFPRNFYSIKVKKFVWLMFKYPRVQ